MDKQSKYYCHLCVKLVEPIRKGRASYWCPLCDTDMTIDMVYLHILKQWETMPVVWYEWLYDISDRGEITRNWKKISLQKNNKWYYTAHLSKEWKSKICLVHRLVAQAFIPNPNNKLQINHRSWIKTDNRVENLERCTASENQQHSYDKLWHKRNMWENFKWRYWKDSHRSKKILQCDLSWNIIKKWDSIIEASNVLWISRSAIINCLSLKTITSWWFKRLYQEELKQESFITKDQSEWKK